MGFRISLYCVKKSDAEKYRDIDEDYYIQHSDEVIDSLEKERMFYDCMTDLIMEDTEGKFSTRYFTNHLSIECDMHFATISRQQLLNIIEEIKTNHILKNYNSYKIDMKTKEIGNDFKDDFMYGKDISYERALEINQSSWNYKAVLWKLDTTVNLKDKWKVSGSNIYEYFIFDLIHILKIFDWDNDVLMAIGG